MTELSSQALKGVFRLQIALGVLLFVPAWSLHYWQAWVYWVLFGGATLAITLHFLRHDPALMQRRLRGGPTAEHSDLQKVVTALATTVLAGVIAFPGVEHRLHRTVVPPGASLLADAVVLLGFVVVFRVFRENSHASSIIEVREGQPVIDTGPYSVVRHPMYSGCLLIALATPVALGSYWGVLFALPSIAVLAVRLVDEERYLVEHLPGYAEYRRRVPYRLLPYVW